MKKVIKRSRIWDETKTKVIILKWSVENIQEQLVVHEKEENMG